MAMGIYEQYKEIIKQCRLFDGFTEEEIRKCIEVASGELVTIPKKKKYFLPEHLEDIYIMLDGHADIIQDSGMNNSLVHVLTLGSCFGIASCENNIVCRHTFWTIEESTLLKLSYKGLLCDGNTEIRMLHNLLRITSENIETMASKINHTQSKSVRVKLSIYLRDLMLKKDSVDFIAEMGRQETADYLNISYPAMLRELKAMEKEGLLTIEGKHIHIIDTRTLIEEGSEYTIL